MVKPAIRVACALRDADQREVALGLAEPHVAAAHAARAQMHVQVDEAGHHELVAQIDDCSVRRQAECAGLDEAGADLPDLAVGDDDGRVA